MLGGLTFKGFWHFYCIKIFGLHGLEMATFTRRGIMKDRVGEGFISIFKLSLIFLGFNSFVFGSEIYEKVRFEEERSFSHKEHFLGLSTGISLPSVSVGKDDYYHYQQNLQLELRGNLFKRLDYSLDTSYSRVLSKNWSENVLKKDSVKGNLLVGYAFPEIKPGWRLVLRGGVYANDLNFVELSHGRKNIIAPQISPLWLYEQQDGSLLRRDKHGPSRSDQYGHVQVYVGSFYKVGCYPEQLRTEKPLVRTHASGRSPRGLSPTETPQVDLVDR